VKPGSKDAFFSRVTDDDLRRERAVESLVHENLRKWQSEGLVPDMAIEPGAKTDEPIRTRGWSLWHQLFPPRHLLYFATAFEACREITDPHVAGAVQCLVANSLDKASRLSRWRVGHSGKKGVAPAGDYPEQVFYNQALNVFYNYAARAWSALSPIVCSATKTAPIAGHGDVITQPAAECTWDADLFITDPPYADAVSYAEITEYFIAWLRRNPAEPFSTWVWDSRRDLAIRGAGEEFRHEMVKAYTALANHMPDNGMQIVMFTHQDAKVWGDMAGIFWAAGLRVTAAWYIATETTSELKKGGYVQGTVILILRKRTETKKAYKDELVLEVRDEVKKQLETMVGLNQQVRARGRSENLFEDADLQMAGYAAALRVLTGYTAIDGIDMTREALRPRTEGERTIVDELIEFAVAIANEELVPDGLDPKVWERLIGAERFYLRMLDLEAAGLKKLDNYQNFAKAFRAGDWQPLMASMKPNEARLKSARDLKRAEFGETEFGKSLLRAVLYALYELEDEIETDEVMSHLRDNVTGYYSRRADIVAVASYLAGKLERLRDDEAGAARVLRDLAKGERLGG
jgi:adenine-specific DNA methylase